MTTVKNINERTSYYASNGLLSELQSKMKEGDCIINFAYTDYGGDFFDKVCIAYFSEKHPNNIVKEVTGWNGENAFIFGDIATEFLEATDNYLLGFEDIENFYSEKENIEEYEGFSQFLEDIKRYNNYEVSESALDYLMENQGGSYPILTSGLDYSESDLIEYCEKAGIIKKHIEVE